MPTSKYPWSESVRIYTNNRGTDTGLESDVRRQDWTLTWQGAAWANHNPNLKDESRPMGSHHAANEDVIVRKVNSVVKNLLASYQATMMRTLLDDTIWKSLCNAQPSIRSVVHSIVEHSVMDLLLSDVTGESWHQACSLRPGRQFWKEIPIQSWNSENMVMDFRQRTQLIWEGSLMKLMSHCQVCQILEAKSQPAKCHQNVGQSVATSSIGVRKFGDTTARWNIEGTGTTPVRNWSKKTKIFWCISDMYTTIEYGTQDG